MSWSGHLVVGGTVAVALGLGTIPLADPVSLLWPDWVLLTLTYWCLAAPHRYGVGLSWAAGLFQDVATATLLGLHALIYVLAMYLIIENHLRIRLLHLGSQTLVVLMLALFSGLLQLWIEGPADDVAANMWALVPTLTTALFWAPVFLLLRGLRRRFTVA